MILAAIAAAAMGGSVAMKPSVAIPASCPVTTVERWNNSTNTQYPFLRVAPTFTGITMQMQTAPIGVPGTAYAPMRMHGVTVVWHGGGSGQITIDAKTIDRGAGFMKTVPMLDAGNVLEFSRPGCWKIHVTSGLKTGDLVLWVAT
jgi:hypothetical protein